MFDWLYRLLGAMLSFFDSISSGIKIIILTVVISLGAALLFPVKQEGEDGQ